nr:MAG TPA: hypothetical protein [Caudoviricetes sp.]
MKYSFDWIYLNILFVHLILLILCIFKMVIL